MRIVILLLSMLLSSAVQAGQASLLINGKALHLDKIGNEKYNEKNWGAGFQYDFEMTNNKWVPFITASGFADSYKNPSYYAGGGALRRFAVTDDLHIDAGVIAFFMTREDFNDNKPFFGALPVISFGTDRVSVNVTYIPKVDPKMVPLLFFQLKIGLGK